MYSNPVLTFIKVMFATAVAAAVAATPAAAAAIPTPLAPITSDITSSTVNAPIIASFAKCLYLYRMFSVTEKVIYEHLFNVISKLKYTHK